MDDSWSDVLSLLRNVGLCDLALNGVSGVSLTDHCALKSRRSQRKKYVKMITLSNILSLWLIGLKMPPYTFELCRSEVRWKGRKLLVQNILSQGFQIMLLFYRNKDLCQLLLKLRQKMSFVRSQFLLALNSKFKRHWDSAVPVRLSQKPEKESQILIHVKISIGYSFTTV